MRRSVESLPEIFGSERRASDLFSSTVNQASARHTVYRASGDDGLRLPSVVVPERLDVEEFFINIATYYQARSPLSAFVHVLDGETVEHFERQESGGYGPSGVGGRRLFGALGAAVGETFHAALGSSEAGVSPTYASCRRSLSFALTRARSIYPISRIEYVAERWMKLRQLTGLAVSNETVEAAIDVQSLLFGVDINEPGSIQHLLPTMAVVSMDARRIERALVELYPEISLHVAELGGPFDARMKAFGQLAEQIHSASRGRKVDSLAVGFFANRIQPGSFAQARAIAKLVDFFPGALIWYGMFCALSEEFDPGEFGFGLVAKLARDVSQPFSFENRPSCDISLDELEVLMRMPLKAEVVKPSQQKVAIVGLMPGVDVSSRFAADDEQHGDVEKSDRTSNTEEVNAVVATLLEDAISLLRLGKFPSKRGGAVSQKRKTKP